MQKTKKAQEKINNIFKEKDFLLPIQEFLMKSYETCTPNKYGYLFPKKIFKDCMGKINEMSPLLDRGDLHIRRELFFEAKISYRGLTGKYNIVNIRPWQKLDYYVLCFVDTQDNFKPRFYCVPKDAVTDNSKINLNGMNNTKEINKHNKYVGMRTTIDSLDIEWVFKEHNLLKSTSYKSLMSFINLKFKNK